MTTWKEWFSEIDDLKKRDTGALTVIGVEGHSSLAIPFIVMVSIGAKAPSEECYENLWIKVKTYFLAISARYGRCHICYT